MPAVPGSLWPNTEATVVALRKSYVWIRQGTYCLSMEAMFLLPVNPEFCGMEIYMHFNEPRQEVEATETGNPELSVCWDLNIT